MIPKSNPTALLASPDALLAHSLQTTFDSLGFSLELVRNGEATLAMANSLRAPGTILLDVRLPGMVRGDLLAALDDAGVRKRAAIALIGDSDSPSCEHWRERLREGIVDDIIPRHADCEEWQTHLTTMHRAHSLQAELESLREAALRQVQHDHLTGTLNRETMLSMLFRETDRVQRMRGSLCLLLIDVDDFSHWNAELGHQACDDLLSQVARRVERLMRSYDLLGRIGDDEFLLALPGCSTVNAVMLAERLRMDVFAEPFQSDELQVRLSACFGVTSSRGRSPVVVLREAEQALAAARLVGPDAIRCATDHLHDANTSLLLPTSAEFEIRT